MDHLIGRWTLEQETELLEHVKVFEQVDEGLWS